MNTQTTSTLSISLARRPDYKWALGLVMVIVLVLGWRFPVLGFFVPVALTAGIVGGFFR